MAELRGDSPRRGPRRTPQGGRPSGTLGMSSRSRGRGGMRLNGGARGGRGLELRDVIILVSLAAISILLLVLIINGIRGCISAQTNTATQEAQQVQSENEEPPAVNEHVSSELAAALSARLDLNEQIATIARDADQYGSENLVYLALQEPSAVSFVSAYPKAPKEAQEFTDQVKKGTVPKLYTYDTRWGYTTFAGDTFAITGSGPTCVAMAYMGLTGSATRTPNALADLATSSNFIEGNTVSAAFFNDGVNSINGLACSQLESGVVGLVNALANENVVVAKLPANSPFGAFARYVLAVSLTGDETAVVVHDPLSAENSSKEWALGTITSAAEAMYSIQATDTPAE